MVWGAGRRDASSLLSGGEKKGLKAKRGKDFGKNKEGPPRGSRREREDSVKSVPLSRGGGKRMGKGGVYKEKKSRKRIIAPGKGGQKGPELNAQEK